jgi:hypothetical protein
MSWSRSALSLAALMMAVTLGVASIDPPLHAQVAGGSPRSRITIFMVQYAGPGGEVDPMRSAFMKAAADAFAK